MGSILNNLLSINDYYIANDSSPTYYSNNKSVSSCIDLCLVNNNNPGIRASWSTGDSYGSDHVLTSIRVECSYHSASKNIRKTDWDGIRNDLKEFEPCIRGRTSGEIEDSIAELASALKASLEKNIREITLNAKQTRQNTQQKKQ